MASGRKTAMGGQKLVREWGVRSDAGFRPVERCAWHGCRGQSVRGLEKAQESAKLRMSSARARPGATRGVIFPAKNS